MYTTVDGRPSTTNRTASAAETARPDGGGGDDDDDCDSLESADSPTGRGQQGRQRQQQPSEDEMAGRTRLLSLPDSEDDSARSTRAGAAAAAKAAKRARCAELRALRPTDDAPYTDARVTLPKLLKYAKRLTFKLDEFRQETSDLPCVAQEHRDAISDLANRLRGHVEDLELSGGTRERLRALLESYDRIRASYYALRDRVDGVCRKWAAEKGSAAAADGGKTTAPPSDPGRSGVNAPPSLGCAERARKAGKGLTECPGVLDMSEIIGVGQTAPSRAPVPFRSRFKPADGDPSAMDELRTWFKDCVCFPCRCTASVTFANN